MAASTGRWTALGPRLRVGLAVPLVLAFLAPPATDSLSHDRDERTRSFRREFDLRGLKEVWLDVPSGEVDVEGGGGNEVRVEVEVGCSTDWGHCRDKARRVDLEGRERGERFDVRFTGVSEHVNIGLDLHVRVQLPASRAVTVHLGAGELRIRELESDVDVHLGAGAVRIDMPESAVRSVDLHASVGEAKLHTRRQHVEDYRSYLVGDDVHWDRGPGQAQVRVDVHVGEIDVRLR